MFLKQNKAVIMLKNALTTNAIFSLTSGIGILAFNSWLGQHIPLPGWAWMVVGIGLIFFALQLVMMALKPMLARKLTGQVIVSDIAWVALTLVGMTVFSAQLTALGTTLILIVNLVVGTLAVLQHRGYAQEQTAMQQKNP